ncbi:hypothetical protein [Paraglaciecola arctica]|uniref:hypothetical protein n=1 Tax=Paraglaciecola arctica TaxID=1128911 RepID=UPI001C074F6A|nr:hypothetical protein [Paraglaciecola arctica]MBU3004550.1 hypothetical protein [Paraglaciecola arctica]
MTTTEQNIANEQASASNADASISDVISAWDKVFQGVKARMRTNASVVAADIRLSIKAVVVTLTCILVLVALAVVIWVSLLAGMSYGLMAFGFHWFWSLLLVLVINLVAWHVTQRILRNALKSVNMSASADLLFDSKSE